MPLVPMFSNGWLRKQMYDFDLTNTKSHDNTCISSSTAAHSGSSLPMSTRTVPWPELLGGGCHNTGAFPDTNFSIPFISLCRWPNAVTPICFRSSCPISARISTLICSLSKTSLNCSNPRLARNAPILIFKLVSGVTISANKQNEELWRKVDILLTLY